MTAPLAADRFAALAVIQQIDEKGRVTWEELRQLQTRWPVALKLIANHLGTTVSDLKSRVAAGEVSSEDVTAALGRESP